MPKQILKNDWATYLEKEFSQDYYMNLRTFLKEEFRTKVIYPHMDDVFNALHYTAFADVKVVILGQDPYHGPNQAHGLSFSVMPEVKVPPSLVNIFKELQDDVQVTPPNHGYLLNWAKQGVLLLNTVLTVRAGEAHSHRGIGWEVFTDQVITTLNQKSHPIVYVLWGAAAQRKHVLINTKKHHIIQAPHPSPLSAYRGFFGSQPFSKINALLKSDGLRPIHWHIT